MTRLDALAELANTAHRSAALIAGQALLEAKRLLSHGQFERWVKENCVFSLRTARDYMRYARNRQHAADSIRRVIEETRAVAEFVLTPPPTPACEPAPIAQHFAVALVVAGLRKMAQEVRTMTAAEAIASLDALSELEAAVADVKAQAAEKQN